MSALFSPTDLVVPFEKLRMTDVDSVGGKNASLHCLKDGCGFSKPLEK